VNIPFESEKLNALYTSHNIFLMKRLYVRELFLQCATTNINEHQGL